MDFDEEIDTNVRVDADVPGGTATVIGPVDLDLAADTLDNVIAAGRAASIAPLVVTAPDTAVAAGAVRAQVVHAAPDAPAVDVYVTAPDAMLDQQTPLGTLAFDESSDPVEVRMSPRSVREADVVRLLKARRGHRVNRQTRRRQ